MSDSAPVLVNPPKRSGGIRPNITGGSGRVINLAIQVLHAFKTVVFHVTTALDATQVNRFERHSVLFRFFDSTVVREPTFNHANNILERPAKLRKIVWTDRDLKYFL